MPAFAQKRKEKRMPVSDLRKAYVYRDSPSAINACLSPDLQKQSSSELKKASDKHVVQCMTAHELSSPVSSLCSGEPFLGLFFEPGWFS